ncbi:MAG: DUF4430 domain-containing protein [Clostridia bacterium]|nr:DUF4430 domain-containing protein [Clostridia bacterium]
MKKSVFRVTLCIVLIAAIAVLAVGCNNTKSDEIQQVPTTVQAQGEVTVLGEGAKQFSFSVTDNDGIVTNFEIHTDKTTVGEALEELTLIAGDEGPYGLYVKRVNGITLDYDKDGMYWAFYINGEMAMSGVDATEITEGTVYSFKAEK